MAWIQHCCGCGCGLQLQLRFDPQLGDFHMLLLYVYHPVKKKEREGEKKRDREGEWTVTGIVLEQIT